jgi:hypothetical protein
MVVIEFTHKNNKNNLILFVHGLTGGKDTWLNQDCGYFFDLLSQDAFVDNHFDIAYFEYYSKLTNISSKLEKLKKLFKRTYEKSLKNISIEELGELLSTEIRFTLSAYDNIIVIAHSMGGLITKSHVINNYNQNKNHKIKLFISLAVPHLGAESAVFGKLITSNIQIANLAPLNDLCPKLNDSWVKLSLKPPIKYFYGTHDDIVTKNSAIGTDNLVQDQIACNDTHTSIAKPTSSSATITAVIKFLKDFIQGDTTDQNLDLKSLESDSQFDDEYFVLKLLLADVHISTVKNSKEHFLNAEYARKLFSSASDQKAINDLYGRIRTVYQDSYDRYVNDSNMTSGMLVSEIHSKIVSEDSNYLKSGIPLIHALHKKGMLHQLANDLNKDIWWSEDKSIDSLEKFKTNLLEEQES